MSRPNAFEVLTVELINRFRLDPGGEFARLIADPATRTARDADVTDALRFFGVDIAKLRAELGALTAAPPLAWSSTLHAAALGHSELMRDLETQAHQLPGELDLRARLEAVGYSFQRAGENVFAFTESAEHGHAGMVVDWGPGTPDGMQTGRGHRMVLMLPAFTEIGVAAISDGGAAKVGPIVMTQNLATRFDATPALVGVAFDDRDGDRFYGIGEGTGGVRVSVDGRGATRSGPAGDYALEVGEGEARVAFSGAAVDGVIRAVVEVGRTNVKLDLVDGRDLLTSASLRLESAAGRVEVLGTEGLTLAGTGAADRLAGGPGADRLFGGGGPDHLWGGGGRDRLEGGGGPDRLWGGAGADHLWGDAGRDRLWGGGGQDRLWGGAGDDQLWGGPGDDRLWGGPGDDRLWGGAGDDRLWGGPGRDRLDGGPGDDRLRGGGGDDLLFGRAGSDRLFGGAGDDRLFGGPGDDRLFGGPGDDRLHGGAGDDWLVGGGGRDVFVFGRDDGRNVVVDWDVGDRLEFAGPGFARIGRIGDDARITFGDTVVIVSDAAGQITRADLDA